MKNLNKLFLLPCMLLFFSKVQAQHNSTDTTGSKNSTAVSSTSSSNPSQTNTEVSVISPDTSATLFVVKAAMSGKKEVALGKTAQQKAKNQLIRDFASRMVKDHTDANNELEKIAAKKSINIPASLAGKSENLISKKGIEFDKAYINAMLSDHEKAVALFQQAANEVQDPDLKAFATKTLPVLKEHLDMAKSLAERLKEGNLSGMSISH
ncbi:DUF4142 domain-containing protein [Rubrolithibacter danxiaensis]|uniref:DUF4142 domain-containing protein n=1 Tax=Rubrolithibacter danxiaensis TaxID=3390805 RepID=UPI003BF92177